MMGRKEGKGWTTKGNALRIPSGCEDVDQVKEQGRKQRTMKTLTTEVQLPSSLPEKAEMQKRGDAINSGVGSGVLLCIFGVAPRVMGREQRKGRCVV